jgi:membrane protein implicated in regulation of membrane protease activity
MWSRNTKTLLFVAWATAICLSAVALNVTTLPWWMAVACVAIVPPIVAAIFWRAPERTLSETIQSAR